MFFKTGDKVVCIDDTKNHSRIDQDFKQWIIEGDFYTIRGTSLDLKGEQGVLLNEVKNPSIHSVFLGGKFEPRFAAIRFRKIEVEELFIEEDVEQEVYV